MARVVRDDSDREWIVTTQVHLSDAQAKLGRIETSDAVIRALSLGVSVLLAVAVLVSVPGDLWAPTALYGPLLLALGLFLLWWAWRRPWSVTATASDEHTEPEVHWVHSPWEALQVSQDLAEEHTGTADEHRPERGRRELDPGQWFDGDWAESTWEETDGEPGDGDGADLVFGEAEPDDADPSDSDDPDSDDPDAESRDADPAESDEEDQAGTR